MSLTRMMSCVFLAAALLVAGRDAYRSIETGGLVTTSGRAVWTQAGLQTQSHPYPRFDTPRAFDNWVGVVTALLDAPAASLLALVAALFWLKGRNWRQPAVKSTVGHIHQHRSEATPRQVSHGTSELREALLAASSALLATAGFSLIINVLMLTGALFMLEIYDRVLPSRSVPTLIGLCLIAGILFAALGLLDLIRGRLLMRAGGAIDEALAARVFDIVVRLPVWAGSRGDGLQPLRDLDAVRGFLSSPGPTALFDLPWLPFYLFIVYLFHPWLGVTALAGAIVLVALTLLTEILARKPIRDATMQAMSRTGLAEASLRNAEVLAGMGFASRLGRLWQDSHERTQASQRRVGDITGGLGAIARVLRMILQSAVLAVGAYLVIIQQASAGIIIAGSILAARALAPVDIAIAHWRGFISARQSLERLGRLLAKLPAHTSPTPLPAPCARLKVEGVVAVPPGEQKVVVRDVSFALNAGQGVGIIGPSGSGKSSLARVLVGAWMPAAGRVRLDGSALSQWAPEALGQHIGYLPQDVELFAGTIAQNIARFDPDADAESVIKAAKAADVHDLIVGLPGERGYDTEIGQGGTALSAGQRQRVALARTLYRDPFLVVLDEPDASLDQSGEVALQEAILGVRKRGGIVVVVSHRQTVLGAVDRLLLLENGRPRPPGPNEPPPSQPRPPGRPPSTQVHILKSLPDPGRTQA